MEQRLFFITLLWSLKISSGLRCFLCDPEYSFNRRIPDCVHFNASDESFITHCPKSTMCSRRETTLDLGNGQIIRNVERGCAHQTTEGEQRKVNRTWENLNIIYEPYEEKCIEDPSNGEKATKTVLCYCRGDLCNNKSSAREISIVLTILPLIIQLLIY